MKIFKLICMALMAIMMCMNFTSCSNEEVIVPEDSQDDKYISVDLKCTGEFLEFSDSPMGRNTTEEWYGIQVYELEEHTMEMPDPENGGSHFDTYYTNPTPYAYGLFASLENVKIKLLEGKKYKFEVGIAINPTKFGNTGWFGTWSLSDYYYNYGTEFAYYPVKEIYATSFPTSFFSKKYCFDRYYGELDIYTPEENGSVKINTTRVTYGVRYEAKGLDTDEEFIININKKYYESDSPLYGIIVNNEPNDDIYTFNEIWNVWDYTRVFDSRYTSEKQLTITWRKADGSLIPMGKYDVTFKRNVKTTIRINAENLNTENGIQVFKEDVPMVNDDNIYEITGGSVVEIPVNNGN